MIEFSGYYLFSTFAKAVYYFQIQYFKSDVWILFPDITSFQSAKYNTSRVISTLVHWFLFALMYMK